MFEFLKRGLLASVQIRDGTRTRFFTQCLDLPHDVLDFDVQLANRARVRSIRVHLLSELTFLFSDLLHQRPRRFAKRPLIASEGDCLLLGQL